VLFVGDGAGNQRGLRGVEARSYAASNRYKEYRDKVFAVGVDVGNADFPNFLQRIAVNEHSEENSDRAQQKYQTEYRINAPDNFINRKERRNQIVKENHGVNHDDCSRQRGNIFADNVRNEQIAGRVDKDDADQKH